MSSQQQMTMFVTDYEKLAEQRDFAAYRALGAISAAICFCRQGMTQDALGVLSSALERYELADQRLQQLKKGDSAHDRLSDARPGRKCS